MRRVRDRWGLGLEVYTSSDRIYLFKHHSVDGDITMAPRRSGRGCSEKHRDDNIPASAQGRGTQHPPSSSSLAMSSIVVSASESKKNNICEM